MKFSENWLREWVNPQLSTEELVKRLTMSGLEVDQVEPVAMSFNQIVIGEVLTIAAHPHADHLKICQVNVGEDKPLHIVCGAANVQSGMRVPTALMGARLGDVEIKKSSIRGTTSEGMLCSAKELGLVDSSEGLMILPQDAPIGENLRRYLQLEDVSVALDLTPNRGDCLSVAGIAREVGLLTRCAVTSPDFSPVAATITDTLPVALHHSAACPRYVGRIIKNINVQAITPLWMRERLRRSGLRSISAVVDVTNYVLLELGQPMHAFDLSKLVQGIQVRMAQVGESLTLLDDQTVTLDTQTLVIADHQQPVAMAGIMGGKASAVNSSTQDIFLESAFFAPQFAAGGARRYGLHTDSSHRFERGVDPQLSRHTMERATALLLNIVGGQPGPVIEVTAVNDLPIIPTILLRSARIKRLLGATLPVDEVTDILMRLGMNITPQNESWSVQPPSFRFDLTQEADLIEELARVQGYNQLPSHLPWSPLTMHSQSPLTVEQLQSALIQRDYQEAITYSFVDSQLQLQLNPNVSAITLTNPITSDMAVMRTTLWTGLLQILLYNQKRQQSRVRLFEIGLRFIYAADQTLIQEQMIAGIVTGTRWPEQWGEKAQQVDLFDVKSDITALFHSILVNGGGATPEHYHFISTTHPALHPGQAAAIYREQEWIGVMGALHPSLMQTLTITTPVYLFELRVAPLCQTEPIKFKEISKYPSIRRDLALVVEQTISAAKIIAAIRQAAGELLIDCQLFDLYQGKGIEVGKKSLAIGLIFQAVSRNLTESEIDTLIGQILSTLEQSLGAKLRK
ncbi:MAG: phenylalanine--tRNA ligase subunit beta [Thioploca sp.]|nr:phenylalanine--tRNA ligase subunit beta [Thioploca sp.]